MALTTEEVRRIASLARLRFTPDQEAVLVQQLGRIVEYIDQIQTFEVGEAGAEAGAVAPPSVNASAVREAADAVHPCLPRDLFLANAPATALGEFLVVPEVKGTPDA